MKNDKQTQPGMAVLWTQAEVEQVKRAHRSEDFELYEALIQNIGVKYGNVDPDVFEEYCLREMEKEDELERDKERVAEAYEAGDYERYEVLIERYARKYEVDEGLFEDWCTDHRLFGAGCCG